MRANTKHRVFGPYYQADRGRYQVRRAGRDGEKGRAWYFAVEAEAEAFAQLLRLELGEGDTVSKLLAGWVQAMRDRDLRPGSVSVETSRLTNFLPADRPIGGLATDRWLRQRIAERRQEGNSVATVRSELATARRFFTWAARAGHMPAVKVTARVEGRANRGKPQLTEDEARRYLAVALERGPIGVAAAIPLLMGLRGSEVVQRQVRDLDRDGQVLWIRNAKTAAGDRRVEIPEVIQGRLIDMADGQDPTDWLWPGREGRHLTRDGLLWAVKDICREAGVPVVPTHGLRGTHSTIAEDAGSTGHVVAATLGHTSPEVTGQHYTLPGVRQQARARRAVLRLVG